MRTCQSRILKEYKTKKADCMWPESTYGPNDVGTLPVCGGDVKVEVTIEEDDGYGCRCCTGPGSIVIRLTCTRCKAAYIPGTLKFGRYDAEQVINDLLNKYL